MRAPKGLPSAVPSSAGATIGAAATPEGLRLLPPPPGPGHPHGPGHPPGIGPAHPHGPGSGHADTRFRRTGPRLGDRLVSAGALDPADLVRALALQGRQETRLGEILLTHRMVRRRDLLAVLAEQWDAEIADLAATPPDEDLVDRLGIATCAREGLVPVRRAGGGALVVTARPERFAALLPRLEGTLGPVAMALGTEADVARALAHLHSRALARRAETRTPEPFSCRGLQPRIATSLAILAVGATLALALAAPLTLYGLLLGWAVTTLAAIAALKLATLRAVLRHPPRGEAAPLAPGAAALPAIARMPVVSVMVPLFREADIAGRLLQRLDRLTYPRALTDIVLVCEEDDRTTAAALARTPLPRWIRVVTVPRGTVQTKPRALNYALDFCRGRIVGIWDAEDAPAPDQLQRIVARFQASGPEVACLQGVLDYYNTRTNWLSRCFTIEYAAWFRVMLPGLERLGLAVPLGGTTVFFRRAALEAVGGWDAHNVTEDADLGIRLARAGYRTELVDTVTGEEATCRALPWIRQRSRWLKGYAVTWAVHMRRPDRLWRDLGPWRFLGVQILFLATLSQFVLAPVLWSCWLMAVLPSHPAALVLPPWGPWALVATFLTSEAISAASAVLGLRRAGKARLWPLIPTLHLYFPLAALAVWRALWEILGRPFFWNKTEHGLHDDEGAWDEPALIAPRVGAARIHPVETAAPDAGLPLVLGAEARIPPPPLPFARPPRQTVRRDQ